MTVDGTLPRVLVVDDDPDFLKSILREVGQMGFRVTEALTGEVGLQILGEGQVDIALVDYSLPRGGITGPELLRRAREVSPETECIAITGHGDMNVANICIEAGAVDFFEKPMNPQRLNRVLHRTAEVVRLRREIGMFRGDDIPELFGHSPAIEDVKHNIRAIASSRLSVVITGETGSGKELVARALHRLSGRSGAFVPFNCASFNEALMEAELFGVAPGAFTGAVPRDGVFARADQGTLLIDEIGEMPLRMQTALLRALEDGGVPSGGGRQDPEAVREGGRRHQPGSPG